MDFNIVDQLLGLTLLGTEWVLWLLLASSVVSVAVMIERALFFYKIKMNLADFTEMLSEKLAAGDEEGLKKNCYQSPSLETQLVIRALDYKDHGAKAMDERVSGFILGERQNLDRGLVILGTLGNNAPFIGLFGTVIGIIQAFADLASNPAGGPSVVMAGISEALVATAVGLLVAIPAVVAYNAFQRLVKRKMANAEAVKKLLVAHYS